MISCSICGYFTIGMLTLSQSHFLKGTVFSFQSMAFFSRINLFLKYLLFLSSLFFFYMLHAPVLYVPDARERGLVLPNYCRSESATRVFGKLAMRPGSRVEMPFFSSFSENRISVAAQLLSCQILSFWTGI